MSNIEHKSIATEIKASIDSNTFEGYASVFGNADSYGDVIQLTLPLFSVPVGLRISQHTGGHMKGKRYTEQQILDILGQLDAGTPISDLTRLHGVASATIYRWKAKYGGMTKEETRKFRQLEVENQRLKKLVADLSLDNVMLKEVVGRKW